MPVMGHTNRALALAAFVYTLQYAKNAISHIVFYDKMHHKTLGSLRFPCLTPGHGKRNETEDQYLKSLYRDNSEVAIKAKN